jgi:hypothetical protein
MTSPLPNHRLITVFDAKGEFATLEISQNASPSTPLMILCGWTGSNFRMMNSYRAWYRAQNFHVLTIPTRFHYGLTMSMYSLDRLRSEMNPVLDALINELPDVFQPETKRKTVVQVWSNGGSHTLFHWLSCLEERSKKDQKEWRMRNVVLFTLDSAPNFPTKDENRDVLSLATIKAYGRFVRLSPGRLRLAVILTRYPSPEPQIHAFASIRFITPNLGWKQTALNEFLATCIALIMLPAMHLSRPFLRILKPGIVNDFSAEVRKAVTHPSLDSARRLFLFGDGDRMVPAPGIRIFRDEEIARLGKGNIDSQEFEGSDHVQHGMVHPEMYWRTIAETLEKLGISVPNPRAGIKMKAKM